MGSRELNQRVERSAAEALAEKAYTAPVDVFVLVRLGWLAPARVQEWTQGRVPCLERVVQANLSKISDAMRPADPWNLKDAWRRDDPTFSKALVMPRVTGAPDGRVSSNRIGVCGGHTTLILSR